MHIARRTTLMLPFAAVCVAVAPAVHATTLPATAYIRDGLVVQYDAIENAGAGLHEAAITAWKDLTGNGHDLPLNSGDTVGADFVNIVKASRTASNAVFDAYSPITIEFNARPTAMDAAGNWNAPIANIPYIGAFGWDGRVGAISVMRPQSATANNYTYRSYNSGYSALANLVSAAEYQTYTACPGYGGTSAADDPVYVNATKVTKPNSGLNWGGNVRSSSLTLSVGHSKTASDVRSIRIYNRKLSAEEIAVNVAVDKIRFEDAALSTIPSGYHYNARLGCVVKNASSWNLDISGSPIDAAEPIPPYGSTNVLADGASFICAAPAVWTNAACNTAATCVGYKVYTNGVVYAEGNATNFTYVHPDCATGASLVWQWAVEYKITTTSVGSGTAAPGEQWVAKDTTATVTATPGAAQSFHKWTGDVPTGVNVFSPTISFSADQPRALVAGFGNVLYLSPDGNDGNDGTSWATALGTMTNAIAHGTVNGSVVNIAAGTYPLPYTLNLTNAITLRGATGRPEDVIIERPASAKTNYRLFDMRHREAVIDGVTLQRGCHATVYVYGGGVYIYSEGGTVTNCILRGNTTDGHHGSGSAVYCASSSGVVTHCVISNNTTSIYDNNPGGAVSMQYGRIDNCLVTKNSDTSSNYGGMIALNNSAVAENCTVVANKAKACSGIYLYNKADTAKVRNCVIAYNTTTSARAEDIVWRVQTAAHASAFVNCVSDFYAPNANCHAGPDLVFADAVAGNWHPTISSSAVDVGGTIANQSTLDLDGNPRVVDTINAGCYELQKNGLMAGFTPSAPNAFTPASVTFTATVIGAGDGDVLEYRWDFDNDGQIDDVTSSPSVTHVYTFGGVYSVSLTVADTTTDETATTTMNNVFKANPRILYVVNGNPGAAEPYDTWATAANTIQKAINYSADGAEVIVSNGTYSLTSGVNVNKEIVLHGLTGHPEDVVLDGRGAVRCLEMNAGVGGLVHSMTLHRGYVSGNYLYGGGAYVHTAGGTISNCIVRGCHGGGKWGAGGGLYASCNNALFTHCVITNNPSNTGTDGGYVTGTAVHLQGTASLAHSLVANNRYTGGWCESTVRVENGTVRFCTIVGNKARDFGGVNLYGTKAKVEYCIIAGNTSSWTNTNSYPNAARYKVWGAGKTFKQSNVASDDATRATPAASLQITNCVADAVLVNATCLQASLDAILPHYASRGDAAPSAFSPAFNAVKPENARAMPATDVFGHPRLFGSKYDIGAVEGQRGTALFLMLQ